MINIELDEKQTSNLFFEKFLWISERDIIEIHRKQLILNQNGTIHPAIKMSIGFEQEPLNTLTYSAKHVQKLVCEHLNLLSNQVIFIKGSPVELEFRIHFAPNKEWQIIVYESRQAKMNTIELLDGEPFDILEISPKIGPYKQLGNSNYYFRWVED